MFFVMDDLLESFESLGAPPPCGPYKTFICFPNILL
jgi:hypothetical protein